MRSITAAESEESMAREFDSFQCPKCQTERFKVLVDLDTETFQIYAFYVQCPKCGTRKLLCALAGSNATDEEIPSGFNPELIREYVIVCNRHKGIAGSLNFWGVRTPNGEKRSFGGYTSNLEECEIYNIAEIDRKEYPVYDEDFKPDEWRKQQDFAIRITQLEELGYRPMLIYYR